MSESNLLILWEVAPPDPLPADTCVMTLEQLRVLAISGRLLTRLLRYRQVELRAARLDMIPKRFLAALLCRYMSRSIRSHRTRFTDLSGQVQPITLGLILKLAQGEWRDHRAAPRLLASIHRQLDDLLQAVQTPPARKPSLHLARCPIYLRTDLTFNLRSGGSVGHIAGVLNQLDQFTGQPIFLSTDAIPTVRPDLAPRIVLPEDRFWSSTELRCLHFNTTLPDQAQALLGDVEPAFLYQRYSLHNFAGLLLARKLNIPFVLEFNGSELWINKHWGSGLRYPELAEKIEQVNLHGADLVVVVSQPMKDELVARGIEAGKILVNPNGVDPSRYHPDADSSAVRTKHQLQDKKIIGFIGTLGPWHGAEVLAQAFGLLLAQYPQYRDSVRLLIVGDGAKMPAVRAQLQRNHTEAMAILPGLVPQSQGPAYLAACDILASPHVPNPDGTPFFGSPTKLFEYMAMGRAIVASDLDQIGQVLSHQQTAWMVQPGDAQALAQGLHHLLENPELRLQLGKAARLRAIEKHTWYQHTRQIIQALEEQCA